MTRTLARPLTALLAAVALLASACGGEEDPASALADAIESLAGSSFSYTLTLDLEAEAAQAVLGPDAGMAAGFVNSLALSGVKDEGAFSFGAAIMGFEPLSLRSYEGGEELFLRVGVAEILQSFGGSVEDFGFDPAAFAELPGDAGELFSRLLGGQWVGFTGLDAEDLGEEQEDAAAELGVDVQEFQQLGDDLRERLSNIDQLLEDIAVVSRTESEGATRYEVDIRTEPALRELQSLLRPLMEAAGEQVDEAEIEAELQETLANAPETIPGFSATVTDGDLTELAFDIGELMAALDEADSQVAPGDIMLRLGFDDHGSAAVPDRPEDVVTYDQEQLEQLGQLLSDPALLAPGGQG